MVALSGVLALTSCSSAAKDAAVSSTTVAPATTAAVATSPASSTEVSMRLIAFKPEQLMVKVGSTVTWRQGDPGVHTVTSGTVQQGSSGVKVLADGVFDSRDLATSASFTFTFDHPGTFAYFCRIHPATMRGEVVVM